MDTITASVRDDAWISFSTRNRATRSHPTWSRATLKFKDSKKYKERLAAAQKKTGEKDALVVLRGQLKGRDIVAAAFEFGFMGGSMGSVVGERFVQGVNTAIERRCPMVCFSASGGARMQESLFSLMQMAKTSAALQRMSRRGLPLSR